MLQIDSIVSGGQTGADRAAFDWAIAHGVRHGGWCPHGRWAEDGTIADRYDVEETPSAEPAQRTEWNVRDSDATVIFSLNERIVGGTLLTETFAKQYGRSYINIHSGMPAPEQRLLDFIEHHAVKVLNIAGPRASTEQQVYAFVYGVLDAAHRLPHT